jgi:hypothetical protein
LCTCQGQTWLLLQPWRPSASALKTFKSLCNADHADADMKCSGCLTAAAATAAAAIASVCDVGNGQS